MTARSVRAFLLRPGPWAALSALALAGVVSLPRSAPWALFWAGVAATCVGAAAAVLLAERQAP